MNLKQTCTVIAVLGVAAATIGCANDRMNTSRGASTMGTSPAVGPAAGAGPADRGMSATNPVGGASRQATVEGGGDSGSSGGGAGAGAGGGGAGGAGGAGGGGAGAGGG